MNIPLLITTAMGLEMPLKFEIKDLGLPITKVSDGRIECDGTINDICRANLWLRTAGRVYVKVGHFTAVTFDELFEHTKALPWEKWIGPHDAFPISKISSKKSALFSKSDSQAVIKKAVAERLQKAHKARSLPESEATCAIRAFIENDEVTLAIDTSGDGLSKRGYRAHMDIAPIRETLAAGMVLLSRFKGDKDVLLDPMCGSGTILIEAGLIARNIAPGLNREFAAERWKAVPTREWQLARGEAKAAILPDENIRIYGSDINHTALEVARKNIALAGLKNIHVQKLDLSEAQSRFDRGKIITNPPYGERLTERDEADQLILKLGKQYRDYFKGWDCYAISPNPHFEEYFGHKATKKRKLYNGPIQCNFFQYF